MNHVEDEVDRNCEGRVAIVTGASRGIGAAIARRLASAGAAVVVSARTVDPGQSRFEGTITETADSITDEGGLALAIAADLADQSDRRRLIDEAHRQFGPIDILVNNGAVTYFEPIVEFDRRHFDLMFEVQVVAPFELAQLVLPSMLERGTGSILNISSKAAIHPSGPPFRSGGGTVYGMVKAAMERFTTGLASEVDDRGVTVNVLSPTSIVATPGVVHHGLITPEREAHVEPDHVMARAAHALVSGDMTGHIAYSQQLLWELGLGQEPHEALRVAAHPRSQPLPN